MACLFVYATPSMPVSPNLLLCGLCGLGSLFPFAKKQQGTTDVVINAGQLGSVTGDEHLIYVLLRHLIDNAIKFRKEDMQVVITLTSNRREVSNDGNSAASTKTALTICIADNGIGFDPSDSERIFDCFTKTIITEN